jgi:hypothetical protein
MRLLPLLGVMMAMSACALIVAPSPWGSVTVVVVVNPGLLATDGTLSVDVWNASQLATLEDNARCSSYGGLTAAPLLCPPGVTFREVVPERHDVPLSSGATSFEVTPQQVNPGEKFRIHLSGPNRDRCNASSADAVRTAAQGRTVLQDLPWQTTRRGCLTPP